MSKEELVECYFGDETMFSQLDVDGNGTISLSEWKNHFNKKIVDLGNAKGEKWMKHLLDTISGNLKEVIKDDQRKNL